MVCYTNFSLAKSAVVPPLILLLTVVVFHPMCSLLSYIVELVVAVLHTHRHYPGIRSGADGPSKGGSQVSLRPAALESGGLASGTSHRPREGV